MAANRKGGAAAGAPQPPKRARRPRPHDDVLASRRDPQPQGGQPLPQPPDETLAERRLRRRARG
jgi:hypothetical protein